MKKILFALCAFGLGFLASAQSLTVTSYDANVYGNAWNTSDLASYAVVSNNTGAPVEVSCKRIDRNYTALTDSNAICWVVCYGPEVSVSPLTITIPAFSDNSDNPFSGHVYPDLDGQANSGDITYVFYLTNTPTDSVAITVNYDVSATFNTNEDKLSSLKVYPNPVNDVLYYEYESNISTKFEIFDMTGATVYSEDVKESNPTHQVNVQHLPSGVYMYSLIQNGQRQFTKKLIKL